ncbi:MAG: hypothetical protein WCQ47_02030 [bacterium]
MKTRLFMFMIGVSFSFGLFAQEIDKYDSNYDPNDYYLKIATEFLFNHPENKLAKAITPELLASSMELANELYTLRNNLKNYLIAGKVNEAKQEAKVLLNATDMPELFPLFSETFEYITNVTFCSDAYKRMETFITVGCPKLMQTKVYNKDKVQIPMIYLRKDIVENMTVNMVNLIKNTCGDSATQQLDNIYKDVYIKFIFFNDNTDIATKIAIHDALVATGVIKKLK